MHTVQTLTHTIKSLVKKKHNLGKMYPARINFVDEWKRILTNTANDSRSIATYMKLIARDKRQFFQCQLSQHAQSLVAAANKLICFLCVELCPLFTVCLLFPVAYCVYCVTNPILFPSSQIPNIKSGRNIFPTKLSNSHNSVEYFQWNRVLSGKFPIANPFRLFSVCLSVCLSFFLIFIPIFLYSNLFPSQFYSIFMHSILFSVFKLWIFQIQMNFMRHPSNRIEKEKKN